jgi:hypothetical protein
VVAVLRLDLRERGVTEIMAVAEHSVSVVAAAEGLRLHPDVPREVASETTEFIDARRERSAEARETLAEIAGLSKTELGVAHVPAFWRAFAGWPRLLGAVSAKHRLVLGAGELDQNAKIGDRVAAATNERSPYWTGHFARAGRCTAAFDDDVTVEIAGATLHYASFNTISQGMMLDAPHSDIVAAEFPPTASGKAE